MRWLGHTLAQWVRVFPTRVGMVRLVRAMALEAGSFPHARGDGPLARPLPDGIVEFSPERGRGLKQIVQIRCGKFVLVRNRANPAHVKDLLGHEDFTSLKSYIKLEIVDLKDAHRKFHPREQDPDLDSGGNGTGGSTRPIVG